VRLRQRKTQIAEKVTEGSTTSRRAPWSSRPVRPVFVARSAQTGSPWPRLHAGWTAARRLGPSPDIIVSKYVDHLPLNRSSAFRPAREWSYREPDVRAAGAGEEALAPLGEEIVERPSRGPLPAVRRHVGPGQAEEDKARFYGKMWTYHSPLERLVASTPRDREHEGPCIS